MTHVARIYSLKRTVAGVMLRGHYVAGPVSKWPNYPIGQQEGFI